MADDDFDDVSPAVTRGGRHPTSTKCPYLDTINRHLVDFDMQKLCSVTLSPNHVYACLVCGKFFEGRGRHTPAYTHSLQASHHVYISLTDGKVWCLPDGYEVLDASLDDIKFALHPRFTADDIAVLDQNTRLSTDILGISYLPGFVGMNNLKHTDFVNVVVQALAHVQPLRDFFLQPENYAACASPLVSRFGELMQRLWSPAAFKSTVSPIEFITEVSARTAKRFTVGTPAEAVDFLVWLLNTLHADLTAKDAGVVAAQRAAQATSKVAVGLKRPRPAGEPGPAAPASAAAALAVRSGGAAGSPAPSFASGGRSIITDVFQGEVEVEVLFSELAQERERERLEKEQAAAAAGAGEAAASAGAGAGAAGGASRAAAAGSGASGAAKAVSSAGGAAAGGAAAEGSSAAPSVTRLPFLFLSLDLPPAPLFRDDTGGTVIAQVPLYDLLSKYDGEVVSDSLRGQYRERKRYRITRLPPYIIMTVKRFARNAFFTDKNTTVVNFPVRNLEMAPYASPAAAAGLDRTGRPLPAPHALEAMRPSELKALLGRLAPGAAGDGAAAAGAGAGAPLEKSELVAAARSALAAAAVTKYDLAANVVHDNPPVTDTTERAGGKAADPLQTGSYRVHVQHEAAGQWYEAQDLHVAETMPQMIGVSQAYIMVYKRQAAGKSKAVLHAAGGAGAAAAGRGSGDAGAGAGSSVLDGIDSVRGSSSSVSSSGAPPPDTAPAAPL
jgi:hypothetical protein